VVGAWAAVKEASARAAPRGHDVATGAGQSPLGGLDRAQPPARARATGAPSISSSWTRGWRPARSRPSGRV